MKLLDLLAKLGILRVGAKAKTYTTENDRPSEFIMDEVFNAKRDLITDHRESVKKAEEKE